FELSLIMHDPDRGRPESCSYLKESTMVTLTRDAPAHVPPELVVPFDHLNGPELLNFPPTAALTAGENRPVFYSSFYGGFWVFPRYEDCRAIYQNADAFVQWSKGFP